MCAEGWEAMLSSLIESGWTVTASWPIDTERAVRMRAHRSAALGSSVHIVCRPRETSLPLLVLFRYMIWTTPKRAEDGFETSAALDGSIGIVPRPFWRL
jgi:adenine-specific DNA methylase